MAILTADTAHLYPADELPEALYLAEQVRELDRIAIEEQGIAGFTLMQRAGAATLTKLLLYFPHTEKITIYCGTGNNGGDGFIIATLAQARGLSVEVIQLGNIDKIKGDAALARQAALNAQVNITAYAAAEVPTVGIIVDAMLGTGLQGETRDSYRQAIDDINASGLAVLAVDIPSGLCSDSGRILGNAIRADLTVTFIGVKRGLLTASGSAYCGRLFYDDLSVPNEVHNQVKPTCWRLSADEILSQWEKRPRDAHKGQFGHVLVVGGDAGLGGAVTMAAQAAQRAGAGLVSVATRPEHVNAVIARCPEVMACGIVAGHELRAMIERASIIVVGPGLGQSAWSQQLFQQVLQSQLPLVIDADGLNLLGAYEGSLLPPAAPWILTPHPGEAARLLDCSVASIQHDRFKSIATLAEKFLACVVLKGAGSLIQYKEACYLANVGNPGMATGGMGDVLSGVIGALMAQGLKVEQAAALGVMVHGMAADYLVSIDGERGLAATDLLPVIRHLLNGKTRII